MKQSTSQAMIWYAEGEEVQVKFPGEEWKTMPRMNEAWCVTFSDNVDYRIAPRTIRIGEYDVPEPIRIMPHMNVKYYRPCISSDRPTATTHTWTGREFDKWALSSGLLHYDMAAACLHAEALASLTRGMACHPKP